MATSYHMVNYRRFNVTSGSVDGANLEQLCRRALDTVADGLPLWSRVEARRYRVGDAAGGQIQLNRVADLSGAVFGELCFVEERGVQALLQRKASMQQLSTLTVAQVFALAEREAPTGTEFVRGLAYWLAIADHMFFLKTEAMTPDHIHTYLNWLLKDRTSTVDPGLAFKLQAEFDKSAGDLGDIRKLRMSGARVPATIEVAQATTKKEAQTRRRVRDADLRSEQAKPVWEAVVGPSATESFIKALGPEEYLQAETSLSIRGKRTVETKEKLKDLANDLADRSDAKIQIEGSDGKISDGDAILRTRMPFDVGHEGSRLLDFDNVADQLMVVYSRFVADKKIDA